MFLVLRDGVLDVTVDLLLKVYEEKNGKVFFVEAFKGLSCRLCDEVLEKHLQRVTKV